MLRSEGLLGPKAGAAEMHDWQKARLLPIALAGLGDGDGDVVAGVGSVRGELGVKDFSRVSHGAEFGLTGRDGVVDACFAVAEHQGDANADVRISVWSYLYDVSVLNHGVGTDRRDRTCYRGVDGGPCRCADVDGTGLGPTPPRGVHHVVVNPLRCLSSGEKPEDHVGREVLAPRLHCGEALALGMVAKPGQARRTDRGGDTDPGGLCQHRGGTSVVRVDRDGALCRVRSLALDENREDQRDGAEHQQGNGHKAPSPVDFTPLRLSGLAQLDKVALGAIVRWAWSRSTSRGSPMARHFPPIPKMLGPLCVPPSHTGRGLYRGACGV